MPHGAPDNFEVQANSTIFKLSDMAELAVRLGSPNRFDRLGYVILQDTFENGFTNWITYGSGLGNAQEITGNIARTGGFSAKLTGGSTLARLANLYNYLSYPVASKIGFEFSFSIDIHVQYIAFDIFFYVGERYYNPRIEFNISGHEVEYFDNGYNPVVLDDDYNFETNVNLFHTCKIICDFESYEYVRLILNNTSFDMAGFGLYNVADVTNPHIWTNIALKSKLGFNGIGYIDDVIITQLEI